MSKKLKSSSLLMVKPSRFVFNSETAKNNTFQHKIEEKEAVVQQRVLEEFDDFVAKLTANDIQVFVFDDTEKPIKPDAIFPNNWVSFHQDGTVVLYPMYAKNRRPERRKDIITSLGDSFKVKKIVDLSNYEKVDRFLEGTGSIVFDYENKIAYACLSPRTDKDLLLLLCKRLNYKAVYFNATDEQGIAIYHTNVMMCIGTQYAVVCLDSISDKKECQKVIRILKDTGHEIVDISFDQMNHFAGNMLELKNNKDKSVLALSQSAFDVLTDQQKKQLNQYTELLPLAIPTIETIGGGSARCMIAEIFLQNQ